MQKLIVRNLQSSDLMGLEEYHKVRAEFRAKVLAHKRDRKLAVGPNVTLYFEDWLTIQYQVQEMLRIERIFESEAIEEELETYSPLIPDGSNFKATFMIEFPDTEERHRELARLIGIEDKVYIQVSEYDRVYAIADEDLERANGEKTSAVHFLRFEFNSSMVKSLKGSATICIGIDHPNYCHSVERIPVAVRAALLADLD
jgi:DNA primase large subunit